MLGCLIGLVIAAIIAIIVIIIFEQIIGVLYPPLAAVFQWVRLLVALLVLVYFLACLAGTPIVIGAHHYP